LSGALARGYDQRAAGSGHAHQARPGPQPSLARNGRAARWWERPACALDAPLIAVRAGRSWMVLASYWALTGKQSAREARRSTRRLGGRLGFGKAREGGIRRRGAWWSPAWGHPVDHRWVVPACLLTRQHCGKRLGCPVRHRHREDPLGVPTAARARRNRCGRAHRHPLLETAAVAAAILVGGHSALQGCDGRRRQAKAS